MLLSVLWYLIILLLLMRPLVLSVLLWLLLLQHSFFCRVLDPATLLFLFLFLFVSLRHFCAPVLSWFLGLWSSCYCSYVVSALLWRSCFPAELLIQQCSFTSVPTTLLFLFLQRSCFPVNSLLIVVLLLAPVVHCHIMQKHAYL